MTDIPIEPESGGPRATPTRPAGVRPDLMPIRPSGSPDWRWARASQLLEPGVRRHRRDDGWVNRARRYRAALARGHAGDPRVARADPAIHEACQLWRGLPRRRSEVEARLLAGQSDAEIAGKLNIEAGVVEAYESVFYDVRGGLGASDWVHLVVFGLRPDEAFDPGDAERIMKLYAYNHGPVVLDALLDSEFTDGQPPADPRLADLFRLAIAVQAIEVTAGNAADVLRLHLLAVELERQEADLGVAAVTKPIVATTGEVTIGTGAIPALPPQGVLGDRETGEDRPIDAAAARPATDRRDDHRFGATG
jgi:hypothetical protein